jgi:hypothetical protein
MCLDYTWAIIFIRRLDGIILKWSPMENSREKNSVSQKLC